MPTDQWPRRTTENINPQGKVNENVEEGKEKNKPEKNWNNERYNMSRPLFPPPKDPLFERILDTTKRMEKILKGHSEGRFKPYAVKKGLKPLKKFFESPETVARLASMTPDEHVILKRTKEKINSPPEGAMLD